MNQIHRDDIAEALAVLAETTSGPNSVYNVVDNVPILRSECYQWLARKLGRALSSDADALPSGKRGRSNKRVSNARLRERGWTPRYPSFEAAMAQSILPSFGL